MTIDDVQYLLQNSVEDSQRLYVDSDKRNREFYPTPSEYVIDFSDPFRNVFAIEILDGTIPSSMYNIDYCNNELRVIKFKISILQPFVPPFSAQRFMSEVGDSPQIKLYLDNVAPRRLLVVESLAYQTAIDNGFVPVAPPTSDRGGGSNRPSSEFALIVRNLVKDVKLYKDVSALLSDTRFVSFEYQDHLYSIDVASSNVGALLQSLEQQRQQRGGDADDFIPRDRYVLRQNGRDPVSGGGNALLYDVIWFDVVETTEDSLQDYKNSGNITIYDVSFEELSISKGNYTLDQFDKEMRRTLESINIRVESSNHLGLSQTHRFRFLSSDEFMFDMEKSSIRNALGFGEPARLLSASTYTSTTSSRRTMNNSMQENVGKAVQYGNNRSMFGAEEIEDDLGNDSRRRFQMISPGIINLRGVRYVRLRIPEIEDYMNDRANFSPFGTGMGIFVLGSRNDVNNIRFDFVGVKNRNIHPIGKLSRLTFRFEMPDGRLYDFKGVNHQLLMNLKMWVPTPSKNLEFKGSVLNEEYNPDIRTYLNNQYIENDDDNDDNDDVYAFMDDPNRPRVDDTKYDYPEDESQYSDDLEDSDLMKNFELARRGAREML